jgi:autotransporter-associated beta strand protein
MTSVVITTSQTTSSDISAQATEAPGAGDDLSVPAGVSLRSGGNIRLAAGDDASIAGTLMAIGTATVAAGLGDIDGIGTLAVDGTIFGTHVVLTGNDAVLQSGSSITATSDITVAPQTAGTAVALGDNTGPLAPGTFALDQDEIATLAAPTITIGRHDGIITAGAMTIGVASFATSSLRIFATGAVDQGPGGIVLTVGNGSGALDITAAAVRMGGNFGNAAIGAIGGTTRDEFAVKTSAGRLTVNPITSLNGGDIFLENRFDSTDVVGAIVSHGGNIGLAHLTGGDNVLEADIDAGAGDLVFQAGGALALTGNVLQSAGRLIGNDMLATAKGSIALDSLDNAVSGHVVLQGNSVSFTNSVGYTLGGVPLISFTGTNLQFGYAGGALLTDANGTASLVTGGSISQSSDAQDFILTGTLNLARTGIGLADITLDNAANQIGRLGTVDLSPNGTLRLVDSIDLTVAGPVTASEVQIFGLTIVLDGKITANDLALHANTITQHVAGTIDTQGGSVLLDAGAIEIDGRIITGTGQLTLEAFGQITINSALSGIGSLVIDPLGMTQINGGAITTSGAQLYQDDIALGAATVLTSTAGGITADHAIDNRGFDLTLDVAAASTLSGQVSGSGRLIKNGGGTLTLLANDTYDGQTVVNAGTLVVDAALHSSLVTVASGGTLAGHGTIGTLLVASGGTLAPGDMLGTLQTGDVALFAGAHVAIALGGTAPGSYDQLAVHGGVFIDGAVLDLALANGFVLAPGESFTLIDNDGSDAVGGTFAGLAEGALVNLGGPVGVISYHGGDGNDVTLTTLANHAPVNTVPGAQSVTIGLDLAIGGLSIADQDAGSGTMTTTLSVAHGTLHAAAGHAAIAGDGTATLTLTGTLADINATLGASVTYHGASGFLGTDTLTMTTSDNGNTGLPGALTDTDTVKINVALPTQAPVIGTDGDDSFTAPSGNSSFTGRGGTDSITFDFRLVDATISYSGNQIIVDGPGGLTHAVLNGIEIFKFTDGTVNDADGSPLVDDLFYYATYHDVWNAHADADAHFNAVGWKEGRDPNAFFDTKGYLAHYTDVAAAGVNPLTHYDQFGWTEGRDPSGAFDTHQYLAHNGDVAAAHIDPLAHFLANGAGEGRLPYGDGVFG